jgi:catalase
MIKLRGCGPTLLSERGMTTPSPPSPRVPLVPLAAIAIIVATAAGAFAFTGGWLSPSRLTPAKLVGAFAPPGGPALGHRRNHAKGICFTGVFDANGNGTALSKAQVFAQGEYPVVGRFNLGTVDPNAPDNTVPTRGLGLQITTPNGQVWRMAMINAPFFPVATPQAFYALLQASGSKDAGAMPAFIQAHPEFGHFVELAKGAPWTPSYAEDRFNGLNAFLFTNAAGDTSAVRWSLLPQAPVTSTTPDELGKLGADHLAQEIAQRVGQGPQRWTMQLTVANPGDPTADPSQQWPDGRRTVDAGTLVVQKIEAEADGPCREINYDPTVLPDGIAVSDDPFPAARSSAYRVSYDLRTAEEKDYPRTPAASTQP